MIPELIINKTCQPLLATLSQWKITLISSFGLTVWSLINGYDDDSVSKPVIEILNKLHNAL